MAFKAIPDSYIGTIAKDMEIAKKFDATTRREALQMWAYGRMWSTGARQPNGGKKGDSYDLYCHHSVRTPEGVRALFTHARVCYLSIKLSHEAYLCERLKDAQVLLEIARRDDPELHRAIVERSHEAQMMRLGSTGGNVFYAHNYISSIHRDGDLTRAITGQLARTKNKDEYDFAFAKYRFYLCTDVGTVW